jgi:hypothetical protein
MIQMQFEKQFSFNPITPIHQVLDLALAKEIAIEMSRLPR